MILPTSTDIASDLPETQTIPETYSGQRLDRILASLYPDYSRSRLQQWLKQGQIRINGALGVPAKTKMQGGEQISIDVPVEAQGDWEAEAIALNIVYEDTDILIINKPVGLVVHPGAGNHHGTLVNALLHHEPELLNIPRAGIVHRLDKDTSGLLVVAKQLPAHTRLVAQLQERAFERTYRAVANGVFTTGGVVDAPIGRDPHHRTRMAINDDGRHAVTHYKVLQRFEKHSYLELKLETGRTHQIRVHMAHLRHALFGDRTYGRQIKLPSGLSPENIKYLQQFKRQALHAYGLGLTHPTTGEWLSWEAPLPDDMLQLLHILEGH